jgi:tetratricopeptide (TPR) repeat protein
MNSFTNPNAVLQQALSLHQAGKIAQAAALYRQLLRQISPQPSILNLLGTAELQLGNTQEGVSLLGQSLAMEPNQPDVLSNRGIGLQKLARFDEALASYDRAISLNPANAEAFNNRGNTLQSLKRPDEALASFDRAIALKPLYSEAYSNRGNTLLELGLFEEALASCDRAIALKPGYAEAHCNRGNALLDLKRPEEALASCDRAIVLQPTLAEAHHNRGAVLAGHGRLEEALASFDRAITLKPNYAKAHNNRGNALMALKQPQEAVANFDRAIALCPDLAEAHYNRGTALANLDRQEEALASFDRAIAIKPDYAEAHHNRGNALMELQRPEDALTAFDEAASRPGAQAVEALIGKAVLLNELGRNSEAETVFAAALEMAPGSVRALFNFAAVRKFAAGDPLIDRMEQLLFADDAQDGEDEIMLHFALGKAWLDAGDAERAFSHLASGNRLKRATFDYSADEMDRSMAGIAATFSPETMRRLADSGEPSQVPVFVIGMPRSGTTIIEQILAAHPQVHGAGELKTMRRIAERPPSGFPQWLDSVQPRDLARYGRAYIDQVTPKAPGALRIVDKMPANFFYSGLIHLMLPNAQIIHCRRDAADTCFSNYALLFTTEHRFTYDLQELGRFYCAYEALMAHWRAILPADRFLEVRYEDVVNDLEGQARRLIAYLGLEWDAACLEFYKNTRQIRTASLNQVRQPIYHSSVGRSKPYAKHLAPLLKSLGISAP